MRRPTDDSRVFPAGPLDAPVIAALQNSLFPDERWSQESILRLVQGPGGIAAIAAGRAFGEVMPSGFVLARVTVDEAEILSLGVLAEACGRGLGRRLLETALDRARTGGARRVRLEVAADNARALALYRAVGFLEVGRRAGYYRRRAEEAVDALVLRRELENG